MLQAREKFLSLRKGTKTDVAIVLEEVLCNRNAKTEVFAHFCYILVIVLGPPSL